MTYCDQYGHDCSTCPLYGEHYRCLNQRKKHNNKKHKDEVRAYFKERGITIEDHCHGFKIAGEFIYTTNKKQWREDGTSKWYAVKDHEELYSILRRYLKRLTKERYWR